MANRRGQYADDAKAQKTWREQKRRYRARTGSGTGERLGYEWTQAEDAAVLAREMTDRELAAKLGRSVQAIHLRRWRLNRAA